MRLNLPGAAVGVWLAGIVSIAAVHQPTSVAAGNLAQAAKVVAATTIKDNLFVVRGGGAHTAVFVTATGVIVVDPKNPGWGQPVLEKIRELTPKPVTTVVNTHAHGDHVGGNAEFPASVEIVAHEHAAAGMRQMIPASGLGQPRPARTIFQISGGRGLPTRTFKDRLTIGAGDDRVELYYFGAGHTSGDVLVVFPSARAMYAGDLFHAKSLPLIDANNGGSGLAYPETLARAHAAISGVDTIITGHGGVLTWADLKLHAELTRDFLEAVRRGRNAGTTAEAIAGAWSIPARYRGYGEAPPPVLRSNVEALLNELK